MNMTSTIHSWLQTHNSSLEIHESNWSKRFEMNHFDCMLMRTSKNIMRFGISLLFYISYFWKKMWKNTFILNSWKPSPRWKSLQYYKEKKMFVRFSLFYFRKLVTVKQFPERCNHLNKKGGNFSRVICKLDQRNMSEGIYPFLEIFSHNTTYDFSGSSWRKYDIVQKQHSVHQITDTQTAACLLVKMHFVHWAFNLKWGWCLESWEILVGKLIYPYYITMNDCCANTWSACPGQWPLAVGVKCHMVLFGPTQTPKTNEDPCTLSPFGETNVTATVKSTENTTHHSWRVSYPQGWRHSYNVELGWDAIGCQYCGRNNPDCETSTSLLPTDGPVVTNGSGHLETSPYWARHTVRADDHDFGEF